MSLFQIKLSSNLFSETKSCPVYAVQLWCIQKCQKSSTYFAYKVHRCSFGTAEQAPHSPFHHFLELGYCTPSVSIVCIQSHKLTTYSTLSTHHPLVGKQAEGIRRVNETEKETAGSRKCKKKSSHKEGLQGEAHSGVEWTYLCIVWYRAASVWPVHHRVALH